MRKKRLIFSLNKVKSLSLKEVSMDLLSDYATPQEEYPSKRVHFADSPTSIDQLKVELNHREDVISTLQQDLKILRNQYDSLVNGLAQKETALNTIKTTLASIHNKEIMANNQVFDKEMEIRKYRNEISDLKNRIELLSDEVCFAYYEAVYFNLRSNIFAL